MLMHSCIASTWPSLPVPVPVSRRSVDSPPPHTPNSSSRSSPKRRSGHGSARRGELLERAQCDPWPSLANHGGPSLRQPPSLIMVAWLQDDSSYPDSSSARHSPITRERPAATFEYAMYYEMIPQASHRHTGGREIQPGLLWLSRGSACFMGRRRCSQTAQRCSHLEMDPTTAPLVPSSAQ
jgi:hypothetical protein